MQLHSLQTRSFRNLAPLKVVPGPRFNVLWGDNAQGKTNFLEAVYLSACLRSFRASRVAEMIAFGADQARLWARVSCGELTHELELQLRPGTKRALVDGKAVRSSASYLGRLNVVLFCPDDLQLPRGGPSGRRRLLDRAIANLWPAYVDLGRDYLRVLQSRNRVLKQPPGDAEPLLATYDTQLAELGGRVVATRLRFVAGLAPRFAETFAHIARGGSAGAVVYRADESVLERGDSVAAQQQLLREQLHRTRRADMARQATSAGPHSHDLEFTLDGRSTRSFGSQGQLRALLLSFKITQIIDSFEKLGEYPVLLLDDVSSELDLHRNTYLFEFIEGISCQTFITTTHREQVLLPNECVDFQVVSGEIQR